MRELKNFCRNSLSGHGTASRQGFWWAVVLVYAIGLFMIVGLALAQGYGWQAIVTVQLPTLRLTGRLILMVAWALLLGVKVRRLHDLRLSGWWVVLNVIPVLGAQSDRGKDLESIMKELYTGRMLLLVSTGQTTYTNKHRRWGL